VATIDVLMPVRNGERYLGESIESIQRQSFADWRLLILDHGSSDGSVQMAEVYAARDKRIHVLPMADAPDFASLLNRGFSLCDARYVMRHDADDIALPERMAQSLAYLSQNPQCIVMGGEAIMIDSDGTRIDYLERPLGPDGVTAACFFYAPVIHPTVMADLAALRNMGAAYGNDFLKLLPSAESLSVPQYAEDYLLFGQIALLGHCSNIGVPLIKYRVHGSSVSTSRITDQIGASFQISRFLSKTFCTMKGLAPFDPVPLSNHGGHLFNFMPANLHGLLDLASAALLQGIGDTSAVRREIAFRSVLTAKNPAALMARYLLFETRYSRHQSERAVIRNWMRSLLRPQKYGFLRNLQPAQ
jgi:glycosyltransferase involved in cell wall biosynthesis